MPWLSEEVKEIAVRTIEEAESIGAGRMLTHKRHDLLIGYCSVGQIVGSLHDFNTAPFDDFVRQDEHVIELCMATFGLDRREMGLITDTNDLYPPGQRKAAVLEALEQIPVKGMEPV